MKRPVTSTERMEAPAAGQRKTAAREQYPDWGDRQGGFITVAVLWILAALTVLAATYAVYVRTTVSVVGVTSDRLRLEAAARGAVELVVASLTDLPRLPPVGLLDLRIGPARVRVTFRTESGRIDLNAAPPELLAGLFGSLGADPATADAAARRIVAWRSVPRSTGEGADEAFLYRAAGRSYAPRQAPFSHVEEFRLLVGLPDPIVGRAMPFLTVTSGRSTVNVRAAPPEVIAGLPGMTAETTHSVLAHRNAVERDGDLPGLLGSAARHVSSEVVRAFQLLLDVALETGRTASFDVVILLGSPQAEPYRVLFWVSRQETER